MNGMDVVFLGTNGWYDSGTGNTISVLIRTVDFDVVLDAGYGIAKMDRYAAPGRDTFLFLSHFHLDHIAGLHTLCKFRFGKLTVCGPAGTRTALDTIMNSPFTVPLSGLPYPSSVCELPDEGVSLPFPVEARPLRHASLTLGYRFRFAGHSIAYCPDTGYCENAVRLAAGADLLIAECAYREGGSNEAWPHLNPETAARIAVEAGARRLALVHFDAVEYSSPDARKEAEAVARRTFPPAFAAMDDTILAL